MDSLQPRGVLTNTKAAVDDRMRSGAGYVPPVPQGQGGRVFRRLCSEDQERGGQSRRADGKALANSLE